MNIDGLLYCARYAFPPNLLGYCGPLTKSGDILGYQIENIEDEGLYEILTKFETLYPYLTYIAYENNIRDPFDRLVVEAYWIGNDLLNKVNQKRLGDHFSEKLGLKKKLKKRELEWLIGKIPEGSLPTHSFHVLNVFTRTGHHTLTHTIETMNNCRIGWGRVVDVKDSSITILTENLIYENGKLALSKPEKKVVLFLKTKAVSVKSGGWISYHWGVACDTLTPLQVRNLKKYTLIAIKLANTTI